LICLCVLLIFKKVHPSQCKFSIYLLFLELDCKSHWCFLATSVADRKFRVFYWSYLWFHSLFSEFTSKKYLSSLFLANFSIEPMVLSLLGLMFLQLVLLIYSGFFRIHL
jgi:hypothetical protein